MLSVGKCSRKILTSNFSQPEILPKSEPLPILHEAMPLNVGVILKISMHQKEPHGGILCGIFIE
jgi:hypothetical protein